MRKIKLSLLSVSLFIGSIVSQHANAQNNDCGWTLLNQVTPVWCYGACNGSILVTPSVDWPDFHYEWSNGGTSSILNGLCAGDYAVTVTDDKQCTQHFSYTVANPDPLVVSCVTLHNESAPGAADGSIQASVSGGWGPYYFQWQTNPPQSSTLLSNLSAGVYTIIVYDEKNCSASSSCEIITQVNDDCSGFRTQTQGGWGQCQQNGNNPGTYLFAHFASTFPNGLTLGCDRTLKLTSAQAVCDFLPSGTTARVLPVGALVDPAQNYRNVFAGQLATAMINVAFDLSDPDFSINSVFHLEDLIITSGLFEGWTVKELIAEANRKIGGCSSSYSAADLSNALDLFNNNYHDGVEDRGFLKCPELILTCDGMRTQTQGGWGQCHQNGNNPGTYLFAHFANAFPNGLTIGCNKTLKLTSAQAVCEFLPSGTTPRALNPGQMVDPGQSYRNVFAGQLVAATLNVGFDIENPDFGTGTASLQNFIITTGLFEGWTVKALIAEANRKIGGCGSSFTNSQLSSALTKINENFVDGTTDKGFLACPVNYNPAKTGVSAFHSGNIHLFPNPMNDLSTLTVYSPADGNLRVEMFNTSGQKIATLFNSKVHADDYTNIELNSSNLTSGLYLVRVVTENSVENLRVIVNK